MVEPTGNAKVGRISFRPTTRISWTSAQKRLAGARVAVADDVADLALEGADVVLRERYWRVVLVDRQLLAAGAEAGELAVEVFDALGAGSLGHGAGLERAEVATERLVGLTDVGVDAGEVRLPLRAVGFEVGVCVGDRVAHERLVREDGGELVEDLREPAHRAREPVDAIDEQQIEAARLGLTESALQVRSVDRRSGLLVGEAPHDLPTFLALDVRGKPVVLRLQRVRLMLLVGRDARVDGDLHRLLLLRRRPSPFRGERRESAGTMENRPARRGAPQRGHCGVSRVQLHVEGIPGSRIGGVGHVSQDLSDPSRGQQRDRFASVEARPVPVEQKQRRIGVPSLGKLDQL